MIKSKNSFWRSPFNITILFFLIIYSTSMLMSLFWGLMTSFKSVFEFDVNVLGFPQKFQANFITALQEFYIDVETEISVRAVYMPEMFVNSILYAVGCSFMATITPCIVAYLCAKFKYKFSNIVYVTVLITMTIPIVGSGPSEIQMARDLGIYDTIWGMYIMKTSFLSMYFLVFHATFEMMPNGYTEAAKLDGASNLQVLIQIILPLVKSTIFTVWLLGFIGYWNDYNTPMIYIPSHPTVAQGMWTFFQSTGNEISSVPMKLAGAMTMALPIIIIFVIFQKKLMGNLNIGGLKE